MRKTCTCCGVEKDAEEFYRLKTGRGGRAAACKTCRRVEYRKRYLANRSRCLAVARAYREKNRKAVRLANERYYLARRSVLDGYIEMMARRKREQCQRKKTSCNITKKHLLELYEQQNGFCALTGRTLKWGQGPYCADTMSIDRIDGAKGYTIGNVRLVTMHANIARWKESDKDLLMLAEDIVDLARRSPVAFFEYEIEHEGEKRKAVNMPLLMSHFMKQLKPFGVTSIILEKRVKPGPGLPPQTVWQWGATSV